MHASIFSLDTEKLAREGWLIAKDNGYTPITEWWEESLKPINGQLITSQFDAIIAETGEKLTDEQEASLKEALEDRFGKERLEPWVDARMKEAGDDPKLWAELYMVINHRLWQLHGDATHGGKEDFSKAPEPIRSLVEELDRQWRRVGHGADKTLKGVALSEFYRIVD